jgi:hypothetical protein
MTKKNQERFDDLAQFLNVTGKSGYVYARPVIYEMAELVGLDARYVVGEKSTGINDKTALEMYPR